MKKIILPIFLFLLTFSCFGQYVVTGGTGTPVRAKNDVNNRIEVYLLNGLSNAIIKFTSNVPAEKHEWRKFSGKAIEGELITSYKESEYTSYITNISDGMGYYVGDPTSMSTSYIWIINYATKIQVLNALNIDKEEECEYIKLLVDFDHSKRLNYRIPVSGSLAEVEREYTLEYSTMEWDKYHTRFMSKFVKETIPISKLGVDHLISPSPLQDTKITLSGDQFAKDLGVPQNKVEIEEYTSIAIRTKVVVDSTLNISGNQTAGEEGSFSAPAKFKFSAYTNRPSGTTYKWKIFNLNRSTTMPVFQVDRTSSTLDDGDYIFEEAGRYRVNLVVSNTGTACTDTISIEDIVVSDFMLWVPNAFSPRLADGVNDIFKVAYKSVIKFNGWILNQWGNELFHWTDPDQGWDGKYRGKLVPPGAYFYLIEATSADGKKHVRKGDVNILGGK